MNIFEYKIAVQTEKGEKFGPNVVAFVMAPDCVTRLNIYSSDKTALRNPMLPDSYRENNGCIRFWASLPMCDVLVSTPWGSKLVNRVAPGANEVVTIDTSSGKKRVVVPVPGAHGFYGYESGMRLPPNAEDIRIWFKRGLP